MVRLKLTGGWTCWHLIFFVVIIISIVCNAKSSPKLALSTYTIRHAGLN